MLSTSRASAAAILLAGSFLLISDPNQEIRFDYEGNLDFGVVVLRDKFGYVYMAGTGLSDNDGRDYIVAKYDASLANEIWRRASNGTATSGDEDDVITGMVLDDAGNVYVVGTSAGNGTGKDIALRAWSSTGTPLWTARYNRIESSVSLDDYATGICIDASGNLCVSGYTVDGNLDNDALAIVFEPDGDIKSGWPQVYGASNFNERFNAIASDASSGVAAAG